MNQSTSLSPASLEELFSRDPEKLTDQDVDRIVEELRKGRTQWAQEEASAKNDGRRAKTAKGTKLDLKSLDLTVKL